MTRLLVAFVLVLLTTLVSDLRSDHPAFAFLGSFERMEGFIALAHLFALFLVARAVLSTERRRRAWLGALVLGSMAVAAMGGLQLAMFVAAGTGRVDGRSTAHPSETALDGEPADLVIDNDGTVEELAAAFVAAIPQLQTIADTR